MTASLSHRTVVVLQADERPLRPHEPQKWNATLRDEPLLTRVRDPEHDACRALLARGITGKVTFVHKATGMAGLSMDIEKGSGLTVRENTDTGRPRVTKFQPFPDSGSSPASVSPLEGMELPERLS
jgi:hypothetical protein